MFAGGQSGWEWEWEVWVSESVRFEALGLDVGGVWGLDCKRVCGEGMHASLSDVWAGIEGRYASNVDKLMENITFLNHPVLAP